MKIIRNLEQPLHLKNPVITIGSFDGVHLGHRRIFHQLKENAKQRDGNSVILTFDPHPQELLNPDSDFFLINTMDEKIKLIEQEEVDYLVILPFNRELADMTFTRFLNEILIDRLGVKAIVMGPNHSFGRNREGSFESISQYTREKGIDIILVPEFITRDCAVRSRKIRELIKNRQWEEAQALLGHEVRFPDTIS